MNNLILVTTCRSVDFFFDNEIISLCPSWAIFNITVAHVLHVNGGASAVSYRNKCLSDDNEFLFTYSYIVLSFWYSINTNVHKHLRVSCRIDLQLSRIIEHPERTQPDWVHLENEY